MTADTPDPRPVSPPSELTAEGLRNVVAIARGRVDRGLKGRVGPEVWMRLAEDLDAIAATLDAARAAPQADAGLEGYWERAYWEIVPKLQAALDAAPQADAGTLREALRMFRDYRWKVGKTIHDLGGYKGLADDLGPLGDSIEAALAASSPATAGREE